MKLTLLLLPCLQYLLGAGSAPALPPAAPQTPVSCTMQNGQPRPYPCEFQLQAIYFLGKNAEVVGSAVWGNGPKPASITLKLPKSKADSTAKVPGASGGDIFYYNVVIDFRRVNTPSFSPEPILIPGLKEGFYTVSTSRVNSPISPGELTVINRFDSKPTVPSPTLRPMRVLFRLQLNYAVTPGQAPLLMAPVSYVQIANPIAFTKFPQGINLYRDRAEAWLALNLSVDYAG